MRMDRFGKVACGAPISMASTPSAIRFARLGADNPDAQDPLRLGVDQQLGKAFGAAERLSPAAGGPGIADHFDLHALRFRLALRSSRPRRFPDR